MSSFSAESTRPVTVVSTIARLQAFTFDQRNRLAALPVIVAFLTTRSSAGRAGFAAAASLVGLGALLRAWCTLYNRFAQGERKTLATEGPYAWLRNPLYVGNTLVLAGCALAAGLPWLVPVTCAWALLVYDQVVRHEEARLLEKYGEAYRAYRARVARWIPRFDVESFAPRTGFPSALLVQSRSLLILLPFAAKAWVLAA